MAKDKITQIIGVGTNIVALTKTGRVLQKTPKGKWADKTPDPKVLEIEDIPRFNFGKYNGEPIVDAPEDYIDWCRANRDNFRWKKVNGKLIELTEEEMSQELF